MSGFGSKSESNKDRKAAQRAALIPWRKSRQLIAGNVKRSNKKGRKNHI